MRSVLLSICLVVSILALALSQPANGTTKTKDVETRISQDFEQFESLLNQKQNPEALVEFLHSIIDQDAKFEMTVRDYQDRNAQSTKMVLGKADFINSYLYGPLQVANYKADFKTLKVSKNGDNTLTSTAIFTERGRMLDAQDPTKYGPEFVSETVCVSTHGVESDERVTLKGSSCKTDIIYEQSI